jgi:hypothetical protein
MFCPLLVHRFLHQRMVLSSLVVDVVFWQLRIPDDGWLGPKHVVEGKVKGKE